MAILRTESVSKVYTIDSRPITVLNDVSLSVETGEFLVIQGASGSGKTTLLSLLSGLDHPTTGKVFFGDTDITRMSEDRLAPLRNAAIGFVFQSFHLVPALTALENVMFPAELRRDPDARRRAVELLSKVGLDRRCNNLPHQLSGGEKQRVAICRALINTPEVIFADEPTGNLDSASSRAIMALLQEFHRSGSGTLVLVTHSPEIARLAGRAIQLHDGRLQEAQSNAV
jgi:putative ABC transport system ATP-binding protein